MSRPSASLSTIKGFSLTFDDFAALKNVLYTPSAASQNAPNESLGQRGRHTRTSSSMEFQPQRGHRHSGSMSSMSSASSTRSWSPTTPTWTPSSPPASYTARPRRLTEREKAELANYTQPEMDITDMVSAFKDDMSFEPLQ
ncbi:hypothetical protein RhiJN_28807 [Ceratobasidium sp. AG-Ba]|nr:hypothetical protein RhiJN_28807 [Ceratobasidium sp. AG-Ba]